MRFCGLSIADPVPDANTLWDFRLGFQAGISGWDFREALIRAGAFDRLFERLDRALEEAGKTAAEIWPEKPAKAAQKDTDARWTVKTSEGEGEGEGEGEADGTIKRDLAIPAFVTVRPDPPFRPLLWSAEIA